MGLVHHQDFPGHGSEFGRVIGRHDFGGGDDDCGHPRTMGPMRGTLIEVNGIGANSIGTVLRICKFFDSNGGSVLGRAVIDNGVQARPAHEFSLPVSNGRQRDNYQKGSRSMHFGDQQIDKGSRLQCFSLKRLNDKKAVL